MQELINLILAGELSNKEIATRLNDIHNTNCDELDLAMDTIEARDLAIGEITKLSEVIRAEGVKAVEYARSLENKLTTKDVQLNELKPLKADMKKLRPQVQRLKDSNISLQKRNDKILAEQKKLAVTLNKMCRENSLLRITGHKQVGKYTCSIFPVRVNAGTTEPKVGLLIGHETGALKVLTRCPVTGEIQQPVSHNFRLNKEEKDWINSFFDICDADEHKFTQRILRYVN